MKLPESKFSSNTFLWIVLLFSLILFPTEVFAYDESSLKRFIITFIIFLHIIEIALLVTSLIWGKKNDVVRVLVILCSVVMIPVSIIVIFIPYGGWGAPTLAILSIITIIITANRKEVNKPKKAFPN